MIKPCLWYVITAKGESKLKEGQLIPRNKIRELNAELKKEGKRTC